MAFSAQNANNLQPDLDFCIRDAGFLKLFAVKCLRFAPAVVLMSLAYVWPLLVGSVALHAGASVGVLLLKFLFSCLAVCGAADLYARIFISSDGLIGRMIYKGARATGIRGGVFGKDRGAGLQAGDVKVPRPVNSARPGSAFNRKKEGLCGFFAKLIRPAYHTTPPNPHPFQ